MNLKILSPQPEKESLWRPTALHISGIPRHATGVDEAVEVGVFGGSRYEGNGDREEAFRERKMTVEPGLTF
jgi:hypothetical protein